MQVRESGEVGQVANKQLIFHNIPPVFAPDSRVLLLGSLPSPKSREQGFYYGHPQNRFWPTLAAVLAEPVPAREDTAAKAAMLLKHHIALWDVLASCQIAGAADASISQPQPNDIAALLSQTQIRAVFCTGTTAHRLYQKLCLPQTGLPAKLLPSTSPANRRWGAEQLQEAYRAILAYL